MKTEQKVFVIQSRTEHDETLAKLFSNGQETPVLNMGKDFGISGNPYGRYGEAVEKYFDVSRYNTHITVYTATSGGLELE